MSEARRADEARDEVPEDLRERLDELGEDLVVDDDPEDPDEPAQ